MGIGDDSVSAVNLLPKADEPTIALFQNSNYGGRMVVLTGAESSFNSIHFNDAVSSIIVISGTWHLYRNTSFKGTKWTLTVGKYPNAKEGSFENNSISSAKPA